MTIGGALSSCRLALLYRQQHVSEKLPYLLSPILRREVLSYMLGTILVIVTGQH